MISWGYAINQWKPEFDSFTRRERHERALKTISVCGFTEIELTAGTGRWEPLGSPERIIEYYDSVGGFVAFLHECGIDRVASFSYDPSVPPLDRSAPGLSSSRFEDHEEIVAIAGTYAEFLQEVGGTTFVVAPTGSYWRSGPPSDETLRVLAACWNAVGARTAESGVATVLHVDCLSALHTSELIARLLDLTDPATVGLAVDTAEATIAGIDPIALYQQHHQRVRHFHFKDVHDVDSLGERLEQHADVEFLTGGGTRHIARWFWEMGGPDGLVDFPALLECMRNHEYSGSVIVESDQSPDPAASAMLNGWYLKNAVISTAGHR